MTERTHSHLRLISTRHEVVADKTVHSGSSKEKQLAFPYPEVSTVFMVYVESMSQEEFAGIIGDYTPRWIIDVRTVPRLDTIATSRMSAFHLFEKAKAVYVDLFGRLEIKSYRSAESNPAIWSRAVFDLLKNSERMGPYLFLFDNQQMMQVADEILPDVIKPVVGMSLQFAHIRSSRLN